MNNETIIGCLLGTATGDALGLPYEGLGEKRARKLFPDVTRHHFLLGRGMVSDDTEHTCFVAEALILAHSDPNQFEKILARSLRWWLIGLPAGVGFATLRSIFKLWLGFSPKRSGVFSAGNGPAMRCALLGVAFGESKEILKGYINRSTRLTHSDPKAFFGAMGVATAAYLSSRSGQIAPTDYVRTLVDYMSGLKADEFIGLIEKAVESSNNSEAVSVFAKKIGSTKGISGYMYHTVPCVIQTWLRYQEDFAGGMREILSAGGDTDTTGAILGGIIGAGVGKEGIPAEWLNEIIEWPRSIRWMEELGASLYEALTSERAVKSPSYFKPGIIPRNILFLLIVLTHGLRRLAPPY